MFLPLPQSLHHKGESLSRVLVAFFIASLSLQIDMQGLWLALSIEAGTVILLQGVRLWCGEDAF